MSRLTWSARRPGLAVIPFVLAFLSACSDRDVAGPRVVADPRGVPGSALTAVTCTATLDQNRVSCAPAQVAGRSEVIYGSQGTYVKLASSAVSYSAVDSTFRFNVTVQNLLPEKIGTADGVTPHAEGIRVFFASGPSATSGTGSVSVANADDEGSFTGSAQLYFQYDTILATNEVSNPRQWQLHVDPTVNSFTFTLYVSTEVQPLIVISEVMANPGGAAQDSSAEYVEIYNAGRFPVNMRGMVLNDGSGTGIGAVDTVHTDFIVPAGAIRVLGRSTNTAKNGGITVDYTYTQRIGGTATGLQFSNSAADHFRIRATTGVTVDSVGYSNATTAARAGVSRELTNPALNNTDVNGPSWADATTNYESTNKGTPGGINSTATNLPPPGNPTSVTLLPDSIQLSPGATVQMSASAKDANGQATTTTFTWTTLDAGVASVSSGGLATGVAGGTTQIIVTSSNGFADTAAVVVIPIDYLNHVEFGTPSDGTPNDEILLVKPQYVVSYSPARGGPNWVSWNLNETHFGEAPRCDCFSADMQLPDSVYRVVTSDYTGSGYSRGHMVMSEQRTANNAENAATFLMTNVLPQHQDQNGGPWLKFETFHNDMARDSIKELYVISGGTYSASPATLSGAGKVQIPSTHWKIAVILLRGQTLADVTSASDIRVISVNMPNVSGIQTNGWQMYKTTVDAIEAATGYDFLADLPDAIEAAVEAAIGS